MSGAAIHQALQNLGVDVVAIDVGENLLQELPSYQLDRVFIALHGDGGEDGTLQGALEYLNLPYTGSGVWPLHWPWINCAASRCGRAWVCLPPILPCSTRFGLGGNTRATGWPVMVKPACEGSSIGMSRAQTAEELEQAWRDAAATIAASRAVIAEPLLPGPEYTVAILDGQLLPSIRIESNAEFYDYQAKYFSDQTQYLCPANSQSSVSKNCSSSVCRPLTRSAVAAGVGSM